MKRHVIYGVFGSSDDISFPISSDENLTKLELLNSDGKLNYGMNHALNELMSMGILPSETGVDLLIFAAHVQAADILISRDTESQNSWTREIRLMVPVSNITKWTEATSTLIRTLNYLTGDLWKVNFRNRPTSIPALSPTGTPQLTGVLFDSISLFSGGLDSLIGSIDLLENRQTPLLISHASEGAVSDAQQTCFNALKNHYAQNPFDRLRVWMSFPGMKIENQEHERTTRGRSFLFFTLGVLAGSGFNKPFVLRVPENGLIALNIPLDQLRLGSHSTRTTHPFYIARWNEILNLLQINGTIENPYWNKTKGEMVAACNNKSLLQQLLPNSLSCSSPSKGRYRGYGTQHCGYCIPCLIRRAAIEKGLGSEADTTIYTLSDLKAKTLSTQRAEGQQIRSFQFAIQRLKTKPDLAKIFILTSGSLSDEDSSRQKELADVYIRGMNEVASITDAIKAKPE